MTRASRWRIATCASLLLATGAETQEFSAAVDRYAHERAGGPFNGVILVARNGAVMHHDGYGVADADLRIGVHGGHLFGIGSLTKPITATAAIRLADRGTINLSDPICRFLSRCPRAWTTVTLRHLLSHTSGIPDYFGELPAAPVDSTRAVIDRGVLRHVNDSLQGRPGTRYRYSNFNYFLVGYALEVATGKLWETILREEVFDVAAMSDTRYDDVWAIIPGRVRGYTSSGGELRHIRYRDHAAYAAGGLLSSAADLLRFERALSSGRLVSDSAFRAMTTPGLGAYGLGWQVTRQFGRVVRNHTGGTNGFASHLATYDDGLTIIVLSNVETEQAKATACDLAAIYYGLPLSDRDAGVSACRAER